MAVKFLLTILAVVAVVWTAAIEGKPEAPVIDQQPIETTEVVDPKPDGEAVQFPIEEEKPEEQAIVTCRYHGQYIRHPTNCAEFFQCAWGVPYKHYCPAGLVFNRNLNVCDWPQNVDCNNDRECVQRKHGSLSSSDDDAESTAKCGVGYVVIDCQCYDPRNCDGTEVRDERRCIAVNSNGANGQRAIAICVAASVGEYAYVTSGTWERNPRVQCPGGYRMINCLLRYPWNHMKYTYAARKPNMNNCESDATCSAGWGGCNLQAICQRKSSLYDEEDEE